jgi:hypothetical protein
MLLKDKPRLPERSRALVEWIRRCRAPAEVAARAPRPRGPPRLNRSEYQNTIRDLLASMSI